MSDVKSFKTDSAKQMWRENIVYFNRRHFSQNQLRNCKVLCFPAKEMQEVFDVYDVLGVKRCNVVGLEADQEEYEPLKAHNDSLEQRIQVVNASALEYLQKGRVTPFDIVSLDYCGYFNQEKADTITSLVTRGWLSPRAILITNYQKGRENASTQSSFRHSGHISKNYARIKNATARQLADFILKQGNGMDYDSELGDLREQVIQSFPVQKCFNGTGYWNTSFFRNWLKTQNEETQEVLKSYTDQFNTSSASRGALGYIARMVNESVPPQFRLFAQHFMDREIKRWLLEEHQTWQYVSDSNTAMISDFYLFQDHFISVPKKLQRSAQPRFVKGTLTISVDGTKRVRQGLFTQTILSGKAAKLHAHLKTAYARHKAAQDHLLDEFPRERVIIPGLNRNSQVKELEQKVEPIIEYVPPELNKTAIYECIKAGQPNEEIMQQFGLKKMQLAGYKAAHTRMQREEDVAIIREFLRDEEPIEDIVDLFEGKYTPLQIASYVENIKT